MNPTTILETLSDWYSSKCNDEWEHQNGISIESLDNPGWAVRIDIHETNLATRSFAPINVNRTENDWINCKVSNGKFLGFCGKQNLTELIRIFLLWESGENSAKKELEN